MTYVVSLVDGNSSSSLILLHHTESSPSPLVNQVPKSKTESECEAHQKDQKESDEEFPEVEGLNIDRDRDGHRPLFEQLYAKNEASSLSVSLGAEGHKLSG